MKRLNMKLLITSSLLAATLFITGCFNGRSEDSTNPLKGTTNRNGIEAVAVYRENVITELDNEGNKVIPNLVAKLDEDKAIFRDYISLEAGSIVLIEAYGTENLVAKEITGKVNAIGFEYFVKDADLEDVFEDLDAEQSLVITEDSLKEGSLPAGVTMISTEEYAMATGITNYTTVPQGIKYSIDDYIIYQDGENEVKLNAYVLLKTPKVNFDFSFRRRHMELTLETGNDAQIQLEGKLDQEIEYEVDLGVYSIPLSAWRVPLGTIDIGLAMRVRANGEVEFFAKATQAVDAKFGVEGELFSGIGLVKDIEIPEDAKDYFTLEIESQGGIDIAAGLSPFIRYTLLQYNIVTIDAELGLDARSNHNLNHQVGTEANYKATVNPYINLNWQLINMDRREIKLLDDYDLSFKVAY